MPWHWISATNYHPLPSQFRPPALWARKKYVLVRLLHVQHSLKCGYPCIGDSLFKSPGLGAVYMEKFQPGLRFHPGCWRMEKSRIIWNTECVLIYELLLFKLFSSFQSVNSRAENSPCNQPLNLKFKANSPIIWIYVFSEILSTSCLDH